MFGRFRYGVGALLMGTALVLTPVSAAQAQNQNQGGLVNVAVGDLLSENNVAVGVAAQLVAQLCPNVSVGNIAVLAAQASRTDVPQTAICETAAGQSLPITITSARSDNRGNEPNQRQRGLVNVAVGDVLSENDLAIGAAAQAVAQICPNLSVGNVAVLAAQANRTNVPQTAVCITEAGQELPIEITSSR